MEGSVVVKGAVKARVGGVGEWSGLSGSAVALEGRPRRVVSKAGIYRISFGERTVSAGPRTLPIGRSGPTELAVAGDNLGS